MTFSALKREDQLNIISKEQYDLLIIGGGITGAGIALDASLRGMKVALIDMQDFAAGTSSRSTKLVHGGLRYLKQFQVGLVAEVGKERAIVYENGPHVTKPEWMLLPLHKGGTFGPLSTSIGLRLYDYLAGVKKSEKRRMLSRDETISKEPLIKKEGLKGGGYYVEYRTDDARLTIEVIKAAYENGANLINYVKAEEFIYHNEVIIGVKAKDMLTNKAVNITTKKVVNAGGPWVDHIRKKDYSRNNKQLRLTKGVHIVIDQAVFPLRQAVYFDTPDGRMVFAIPRDGKTYVGTTDTFYGENATRPNMLEEDREYILNAMHFMFPKVKVTHKDIESSWAGVRPLIYEEGKDPSEISRKDEIWEGESGLITIAGGKLTGYRKMAESVVDLIAKRLGEDGQFFKESKTKTYPISGGKVGGSKGFHEYSSLKEQEVMEAGFTKEEGRRLVQMYGSNVNEIFHYATTFNVLENTKLTKIVYSQLMYSIEHEMAATPADFFIRRTGALFFNINWVRTWKDEVLLFMEEKFNWNKKQTALYKEELEIELKDAVIPVDLQQNKAI
ncbi:glycerol-3-phosphate dehydrogenase/oxidase [Neobacillus sp. DY30]|uniref:glycerol-3-phosphate dehydrogenase/oxidase n=1 Tax=Neobacillus sp. DY30 TaxID=3047871 RepID=UPI0024BFDEA0|nr:glycerol-3-phosphate dehydrogenase/oxidase [Neobacillus sp. DY30]WHY02719.1 glycerol-3-phosphate dehydrogenase/oxidase [Neobacillus sp. DY30]